MSQEEKVPDPVFHFSDNFSTAYFGNIPPEVSGEKNPSDDAKLISNFIGLLTNPEHRIEKLDALNIIRQANAQQFLVDLISMPKFERHQKELVMACWESGLDFSTHLIFFTNLVVNCGYPVAMEAITVIDEMLVINDRSILDKAIILLSEASINADKQLLISDTLERLRFTTV